MSAKFQYSQDRFSNALQILRDESPRPLRGWPDALSGRLWVAIIEIYACTPHDFARRQDYDEFASLLAELRERSTSHQVLEGIRNLAPAECLHFTSRLKALAQSVVTAFVLVALPQCVPTSPAVPVNAAVTRRA